MFDNSEGMVLLDARAGDRTSLTRDLLTRFGHPVTTCGGPNMKTLCPLLGGRGCADFQRAHGVIFALDLDRPQHRAILRRYRELAGDEVPIRVVVTPRQEERYSELLAGFEVWTAMPTVAEIDGFAARVEAVDRCSVT